MNKPETLKVLAVLRAAYPRFYHGMTQQDYQMTVNLWQTMFDEEPYALVMAGVKALLSTDTKGFPPHIGAVKEQIRVITKPEVLTETEAWDLVRRALKNSSTGMQSRLFKGESTPEPDTAAERAFKSLPPEVQAIVHSPEQLEAWGQVELDTLNTVVASNFMRSYRARTSSQQNYDKLPESVKEALPKLRGMMEHTGGALPTAKQRKLYELWGEEIKTDDG